MIWTLYYNHDFESRNDFDIYNYDITFDILFIFCGSPQLKQATSQSVRCSLDPAGAAVSPLQPPADTPPPVCSFLHAARCCSHRFQEAEAGMLECFLKKEKVGLFLKLWKQPWKERRNMKVSETEMVAVFPAVWVSLLLPVWQSDTSTYKSTHTHTALTARKPC